jgi:hypothetical protein
MDSHPAVQGMATDHHPLTSASDDLSRYAVGQDVSARVCSAAAVQGTKLQLSSELVVLRNTVLGGLRVAVAPALHLSLAVVLSLGPPLEGLPDKGLPWMGLPYQCRPRLRACWLKRATTSCCMAQ